MNRGPPSAVGSPVGARGHAGCGPRTANPRSNSY